MQTVSFAGRVTFIENQIKHMQYGPKPLLLLRRRWHEEWHTGVFDGLFGAANALCHGCLWHEEGVGDLGSR